MLFIKLLYQLIDSIIEGLMIVMVKKLTVNSLWEEFYTQVV